MSTARKQDADSATQPLLQNASNPISEQDTSTQVLSRLQKAEAKPAENKALSLQQVQVSVEEYEKIFPWWKEDNDVFIQDLKRILLENPFLLEAMKNNPLPKRHPRCWSPETLKILISAILAGMATTFYVAASAEGGPMYTVGGGSVNGIQMFAYAMGALNFLKNSTNKSNRSNLIIGIVGGVLSSLATNFVSDEVVSNPVISTLAPLGELPLNVFGIAEGVKFIRESADSDRALTEAFMQELQRIFEKSACARFSADVRAALILPHYNKIERSLQVGIGTALSTTMVGSMEGYIYSTFLNATKKLGNKGGGIVFSILGNISVVSLALLAGIKLGKKMAIALTDHIQFFLKNQKKKIVLTRKNLAFFYINCVMILNVSVLAYYSNQSAIKTNQKTPPINDVLDIFFAFCVAQGTRLFNGVQTFDAVSDFVNHYIKMAYYANNREKAVYQLAGTINALKEAPATTLKGIKASYPSLFDHKASPVVQVVTEQPSVATTSVTASPSPRAQQP